MIRMDDVIMAIRRSPTWAQPVLEFLLFGGLLALVLTALLLW